MHFEQQASSPLNDLPRSVSHFIDAYWAIIWNCLIISSCCYEFNLNCFPYHDEKIIDNNFDKRYFICIDVYKYMESSSATIVILCGISNRTAYCARIIVVHVAETILTVYHLHMEWELQLLFFLSALSKPNV